MAGCDPWRMCVRVFLGGCEGERERGCVCVCVCKMIFLCVCVCSHLHRYTDAQTSRVLKKCSQIFGATDSVRDGSTRSKLPDLFLEKLIKLIATLQN